MIAKVYIDSTSSAIDHTFDYEVPSDLQKRIKPAMRVVVPFGRGNKPCQAFVVSLEENSDYDGLKSILRTVDDKPAIPEYLVKVADFLRGEYFCTYAEAIKTVLPYFGKDKINEKTYEYVTLKDGVTAAEALGKIRKNALKQREVLSCLISCGKEVRRDILIKRAKASSQVINSLLRAGLIQIKAKADEYSPREHKTVWPEFNEEQRKVFDVFIDETSKNTKKFLLHGVTGSGKTLVYFAMFEEFIKKGRQCLLLVPEISLTPQMMSLTSRRFEEEVVIVHSRLTLAERMNTFARIKDGRAKIVLGARSAIFMPFKDLAMIVVDEEHETSYKSSQSPRYDTAAVANEISDLTGATLLFSSATPSVESYYKANTGEYKLLNIEHRVFGRQMPKVRIADMRKELYSGNRSPISRILKDEIAKRLGSEEQVVLFLNRRGFSTYVFCRSCGYIEQCPNCAVSLTYHHSSESLICHYCAYKKKMPKKCPECASDKIKYMGTGTQKIETYIKRLFPEARILRLDSDTAKTKGAYDSLLGRFARGEADILIGTQMVVKGLDFQNVTLVGIVLADTSLTFPDLNAAARTFQLTAQAAGRAGRGEKPGEVIMQTYQPQNATLVYASRHDYKGFYAYDIAHRQQFGYPPFSEIFGLFAANESVEECIKDIERIFSKIKTLHSDFKDTNIKLYSPAPAYIQKLKGKYIYHMLVSYPAGSEFKRILRDNYNELKQSVGSNVFVEINPITLL